MDQNDDLNVGLDVGYIELLIAAAIGAAFMGAILAVATPICQ